jgi:hypothetical protein
MFNPLQGCFFHFGLFNYILRNESGKNIFLNLAIFNRASSVVVTYEGITLVHMT